MPAQISPALAKFRAGYKVAKRTNWGVTYEVAVIKFPSKIDNIPYLSTKQQAKIDEHTL